MESTFTPHGRMRRTDYAVSLAVLNLAMIGVPTVIDANDGALGVVRSAMMLALAWLLYCSMSRRLHDAGRTSVAGAVLLALVAIGGILMKSPGTALTGQVAVATAALIGAYVLIAPTNAKATRHGRDPRAKPLDRVETVDDMKVADGNEVGFANE